MYNRIFQTLTMIFIAIVLAACGNNKDKSTTEQNQAAVAKDSPVLERL